VYELELIKNLEKEKAYLSFLIFSLILSLPSVLVSLTSGRVRLLYLVCALASLLFMYRRKMRLHHRLSLLKK